MILEVKDLQISYGNKVTVNNIDFTLDQGEILSIVGESGSGKTTLSRAIMGCLPSNGHITNGHIYFAGKDITKNSISQWQKICGKDMSMIFQDCGNMLNPIRKIGVQFIDYIIAHSPEKSRSEAYQEAYHMLEQVYLSNPKNIMQSYPFELSGGMRQRVGIAMAITFKPKVLLADEPTSALDVTTQAQIVQQILDLRKEFNIAVIMVTHNLGVASYMSDKIMVMKNGGIVEYGTQQEVIFHSASEYTKQLLDAIPVLGGKRYYESV